MFYICIFTFPFPPPNCPPPFDLCCISFLFLSSLVWYELTKSYLPSNIRSFLSDTCTASSTFSKHTNPNPLLSEIPSSDSFGLVTMILTFLTLPYYSKNLFRFSSVVDLSKFLTYKFYLLMAFWRAFCLSFFFCAF